MKEMLNERYVNVMVDIKNEDCYKQMIPCHYCGYVMNLEKIEEDGENIIYTYECCNCGGKLILTYKPFIKNMYRLENEKWEIK